MMRPTDHRHPFIVLVMPLAVFLLVAAPLALYCWHVLSEALSGRIEPRPIAIAAVLAIVLVVLAGHLGSFLQRIEKEG